MGRPTGSPARCGTKLRIRCPVFSPKESGKTDMTTSFLKLVRRMKPGDRIAIKASFVQKSGLPFDVGGKSVSAMRIKATGTILENLNDGKKVRVAWDPPSAPRDWYFYTYRTTVVEADIESEDAKRLVDFVFRGVPQDYAWFLAQPYWVQKYGVRTDSVTVPTPVATASPKSQKPKSSRTRTTNRPIQSTTLLLKAVFSQPRNSKAF